MMTRKDLDRFRYLMIIVFTLLGVGITYVRLSDIYYLYRSVRHYKQTTAIVSNITYFLGSRTTYALYEVNGVSYEKALDSLFDGQRGRQRGDKIKIYYDPQKPNNRIYPEGYGENRLFFTTLTITIVIGIWWLLPLALLWLSE